MGRRCNMFPSSVDTFIIIDWRKKKSWNLEKKIFFRNLWIIKGFFFFLSRFLIVENKFDTVVINNDTFVEDLKMDNKAGE